MSHLKICLSLTLILTLTSCAPPKLVEKISSETTAMKESPKETTKPKIKSHQLPSSFKLVGAIAVNKNGKGWNASIDWTQKSASQYNIRLSGPVGSKNVIITKQNSLVTYRDGSKTIRSNSGDDLLKQKTKINIPVNNLYYWVRGMPAPGSIQSVNKNTDGQLQYLKQAGFTITYNQYMTDSHGNILPRKIRLQGNGVIIKLAISSWS